MKTAGTFGLAHGTHFEVCSNTNDLQNSFLLPTDHQVLADWVRASKDIMRQRPIDHYRNRRTAAIGDLQIAAAKNWDIERS